MPAPRSLRPVSAGRRPLTGAVLAGLLPLPWSLIGCARPRWVLARHGKGRAQEWVPPETVRTSCADRRVQGQVVAPLDQEGVDVIGDDRDRRC